MLFHVRPDNEKFPNVGFSSSLDSFQKLHYLILPKITRNRKDAINPLL
jgi:hypothetical protein